MQNNKSNCCAYCRESGPMTREHIVPDFLYQQYPDQKFGLHPRAKRFKAYENKIRDVCQSCNSGPLSKLDQYGKSFTTENRCDVTYDERKYVTLIYDFDLLVRWLLKISYNAMRAYPHDTSAIESWIPFILKGENAPWAVRLWVEIVLNAPISPSDRQYLHPEMPNSKSLSALSFGGGPLPLDDLLVGSNDLGRFIKINAYYFFLLSSPSETEIVEAERELRRQVPQAAQLHPNAARRPFRVSKRTIMQVQLYQKLLELPYWKEREAAKR